MKLVIYTQYRENYGAHSWDGSGTCPQYWKSKGGDTYVYENISLKHVDKIRLEGIPTLKSLIEYHTDYAHEYVIDWSVQSDYFEPCEEYEISTVLAYRNNNWYASRTKDNSYAQLPADVVRQVDTWRMLPQGQFAEFESTITLKTGEIRVSPQISTH